ncbi:MAG: hypothetical protein M3541_00610 [Acidobacteriota bacterium]|nr:hypothetical protein [Acidobacteriota bacterium]MDQ3417285.1 hypothetical protein [Acidobacteriota bacterium]
MSQDQSHDHGLIGLCDTLALGQIYLPLVLATVGSWLLLERGRYAVGRALATPSAMIAQRHTARATCLITTSAARGLEPNVPGISLRRRTAALQSEKSAKTDDADEDPRPPGMTSTRPVMSCPRSGCE